MRIHISTQQIHKKNHNNEKGGGITVIQEQKYKRAQGVLDEKRNYEEENQIIFYHSDRLLLNVLSMDQ